jgi:hypothetical protein
MDMGPDGPYLFELVPYGPYAPYGSMTPWFGAARCLTFGPSVKAGPSY